MGSVGKTSVTEPSQRPRMMPCLSTRKNARWAVVLDHSVLRPA